MDNARPALRTILAVGKQLGSQTAAKRPLAQASSTAFMSSMCRGLPTRLPGVWCVRTNTPLGL